jgi:7-carboxy-7-deazaguanine synthase
MSWKSSLGYFIDIFRKDGVLNASMARSETTNMASAVQLRPGAQSGVVLNTLPVVEAFHSIQGEGCWMGTSAFFIRLAGCDVGCPWCDTKQSWPVKPHPLVPIDELVRQAQAAQPQIVVITGGEPLMHDLSSLTEALQQAGLRIHLETSGSHPFSGTFDWVTLSPKRYKPPLFNIYPHIQELKVVIADITDFAWAEEQAMQVPATVTKQLQPEWTTPDSRALVFQYVLQHPQWRVSLQTHKFIGVQ